MKLKTFKFPSFKEWKKTAFMSKKMGNIGDFYAEIQINGNIYKAVLNYSYPGSNYKVYENIFNYDITKPDELEKWYSKIQKDMNSLVEKHAIYDVLYEYHKELTRYFDGIDTVESEFHKVDSRFPNKIKTEVKAFDLPSYEDWNDGQDFQQCIGEYECRIHGYSWFPKFTNEQIYEATIKYYDYDGPKVIFESRISCLPDDYYQLSKWYKDVESKINEKWKDYISNRFLK